MTDFTTCMIIIFFLIQYLNCMPLSQLLILWVEHSHWSFEGMCLVANPLTPLGAVYIHSSEFIFTVKNWLLYFTGTFSELKLLPALAPSELQTSFVTSLLGKKKKNSFTASVFMSKAPTVNPQTFSYFLNLCNDSVVVKQRDLKKNFHYSISKMVFISCFKKRHLN